MSEATQGVVSALNALGLDGTIASLADTFPRRAVGSVVGLGGLAGAISGLLVSPAVGYWLDSSNGSYRPLFVVAGTAYLAAFALIHACVPQLDRPDA